jgi:O-antigen ligase
VTPAGPPRAVRRAADVLLAATIASVPLSTTGMEAGVVLLGVLALVSSARGWGVVRRTPLDGALVVFYGALALSTLASGRPLEATGWAKAWVVLAYFAVFWWTRDGAHAGRLARLLVLAGAVAGAYGILQHFTGADWYRRLLGRTTFVRPREAGDEGFAAIGFFRNYLTYAHTMLFPLAFAAAFALAGRRLAGVAAAIVAVAVVFSTARGAWLAALGAGAVLALAAGGRRAGAGAGFVALAAVLVVALAPPLRAAVARAVAVDGPNAGRIGIYAANLDVVHERPVFGLGFGRYQLAAGPYYAAHPTADRRSHAHNNFLQIAAESGLVGLAAFGLLWAAALRHGVAAIVAAPDRDAWAVAAGATAGVTGFLVGGLTQYTFGDAEVAIAMWTALALLVRSGEGDGAG